jgi:NDP-4-keto-2,6-dideoxyhexose 3-C-methyltransferase
LIALKASAATVRFVFTLYKQIERCRICRNTDLRSVLHLGYQSLTGIFPRRPDAYLSSGPLELVRCHGDGYCGLVQLRHSYDLGEMYGENYGYRSSLNRSMVEHLHGKVAKLRQLVPVTSGDLVLDIGSNDGTLLAAYPAGEATLCGIDPTGAKFKQYYRADIGLIPDFFSAELIRRKFPDRRAKIVTSIAMFYDIEDPLAFMREIESILDPARGIWHFEQSYLPSMLKVTAYDTICHEHIEYYGLHQIKWLADRAGLKILDVELNDINGGSFNVTVAKTSADYPVSPRVAQLLADEKEQGLAGAEPFEAFAERVVAHKAKLTELLAWLKAEKARVLGYGASTKGNVILQYCGITPSDITHIAEVNADKFGCFTPGTGIPIISEADAHAMKPDYFLVLPWHFKANLLKREQTYLSAGGRMIFPLPSIEIIPP